MRKVPPWARLAAVAVLVIAIVVGAIVALAGSGPSQMTITALFSTAPGLYLGNQVKILGMPVGTVTKVTPGPRYVTVQMQVPTSVPIPADAQALIMAPQVVNDRYVQLNPAYSAGPRMKNDAVIPDCHRLPSRSPSTASSTASTSWRKPSVRRVPTPTARSQPSWRARPTPSAPTGRRFTRRSPHSAGLSASAVVEEPSADSPVRQPGKPERCGIALHRHLSGVRKRPGGREHRARFGRRRHRCSIVEPSTGSRVIGSNSYGPTARHSETV